MRVCVYVCACCALCDVCVCACELFPKPLLSDHRLLTPTPHPMLFIAASTDHVKVDESFIEEMSKLSSHAKVDESFIEEMSKLSSSGKVKMLCVSR